MKDIRELDFDFVMSWEDDGFQRISLVKTPSGEWKVNILFDSEDPDTYPQLSITQLRELYHGIRVILSEYKKKKPQIEVRK